MIVRPIVPTASRTIFASRGVPLRLPSLRPKATKQFVACVVDYQDRINQHRSRSYDRTRRVCARLTERFAGLRLLLDLLEWQSRGTSCSRPSADGPDGTQELAFRFC